MAMLHMAPKLNPDGAERPFVQPPDWALALWTNDEIQATRQLRLGIFCVELRNEGFTYGHIAKAIGLSRERVRQIILRARSRIAQRQRGNRIQATLSLDNPPHPAADPHFPATATFTTREGGPGILQIVGFTGSPHVVKSRYKLVGHSARH